MMMKQKHQLLGEEGGVLMTEDLYTVGNDEVYIVFMEDSATLTTEGTDDDAVEDFVMITNAGGGTVTFTATTVTLGSVNENDQYLVITDPAALPFRVRSSLYSNIVSSSSLLLLYNFLTHVDLSLSFSLSFGFHYRL